MATLQQSPGASSPKPCFSPDSDDAALTQDLETLVSPRGHWALSTNGMALERSFKFKTFAKTWARLYDGRVAAMQSQKPSPRVFNTLFVRWTTHHPRGLSSKDIAMAALCDALARDFGELDVGPTDSKIRELADKAQTSAADCCMPKS
ncbi:hypothetical protein CDD82_5424 [Ophiocordyceps australis]|uniref:4a-hydroxytetrahydrobiopterin dehydratase n=1 Tax=Ophiocordyceps australis TaxID=1399860 RepID=A0A2C5ZUH8_9HYPO|nr:hypothetical protein CDD82_5424 [Ophiocordyceps australis]